MATTLQQAPTATEAVPSEAVPSEEGDVTLITANVQVPGAN